MDGQHPPGGCSNQANIKAGRGSSARHLMKRENPTLPSLISGGAPNNPMGARAVTLSGGKYAIHGTNRPESVGRDASYGCIRMFNDHIIDLYDRVTVGTKVIVTRGS